MGVLQDVEASPFTFEAFNVLLGTCCMERYGLHGVNMELLTINECVGDTRTNDGIGMCLWAFHPLQTVPIDVSSYLADSSVLILWNGVYCLFVGYS